MPKVRVTSGPGFLGLTLHRRHVDFLMVPMVATMAACTLVMIALAYRRHLLPFLRWPSAGRQSTQPYRALIAIEYASLIALALVNLLLPLARGQQDVVS